MFNILSMKNILWVLVLIITTSCNETSRKSNALNKKITEADAYKISEGFNLLENSCFSCHNPNPSIDNNITPSLAAIKKHYINKNTSFKEFLKDFTTFLNNPTKENSKIPNALKRFGVMPKMSLTEGEIENMALYIYNTELEKSNWFEKHFNEEKAKHNQKSNTPMSALEIGKKIAMQTKSTLGSNLKQALNTKGTEEAVSFCSTSAMPLTDSMAISLNANIKRVSDKNRNPKNKANDLEMEYINNAKNALMNNQQVKPKLIKTDTGHTAYYPIITNNMCLQCHGDPDQDINPKVYAKTQQLYPEDQAVGYKSDELRGIWVIEMKDK